jgi:hypothetical protein
MGLIRNILGLGKTVGTLAEVFVPNKTRKLEYDHADFQTVLGQYTAEFHNGHIGFFNRLVNALNRLPRPVMALGTVGLFVFAMVDPEKFTVRMDGLNSVPDQLWWLLGAIVSFYFGARELHHLRSGKQPSGNVEKTVKPAVTPKKTRQRKATLMAQPAKFPENAALSEWAQNQE